MGLGTFAWGGAGVLRALLRSPARGLWIHAIANAIAWVGLGVSDHEAGVVDDRFSSTITFDNEEDARKAVVIIRKVIRATQPGE